MLFAIAHTGLCQLFFVDTEWQIRGGNGGLAELLCISQLPNGFTRKFQQWR